MNAYTKFKEGLALLAVLAFTFVSVCFGVLLIHANKTLNAADATLVTANMTLGSVNTQVTQLGKTQDKIVGAVTVVTDTVTSFRQPVSAILANFNGLLFDIDGDTKQITDGAVGTLSAMTAIEQSAKPVLDNAATTLATTHVTISDLDKFITAPELKAVITNTATITDNAGKITDTANQVMTKSTKSYLHPVPLTPMQKFKEGLKTWGLIVAKLGAQVL